MIGCSDRKDLNTVYSVNIPDIFKYDFQKISSQKKAGTLIVDIIGEHKVEDERYLNLKFRYLTSVNCNTLGLEKNLLYRYRINGKTFKFYQDSDQNQVICSEFNDNKILTSFIKDYLVFFTNNEITSINELIDVLKVLDQEYKAYPHFIDLLVAASRDCGKKSNLHAGKLKSLINYVDHEVKLMGDFDHSMRIDPAQFVNKLKMLIHPCR